MEDTTLLRQQLSNAIHRSDLTRIRELITLHSELTSQPDSNGRMPLEEAISGLDRTVECVRVLLELGCDAALQDRFGYNALHYNADISDWTCRSNIPGAISRLLVAYGADVEAVDFHGYTPLMKAVESGTGDELLALLDVGANPNKLFTTYTEGQSALSVSVFHPDKVCMLLQAGADPNLRDQFGETALEYAGRMLQTYVDDCEETFCIQSSVELLEEAMGNGIDAL